VPRQAERGGPAANAYTFVDLSSPAGARARYLTWVNLYDIEYAAAVQQGRWTLAEPQFAETFEVDWAPFGWGERPFPNVADR